MKICNLASGSEGNVTYIETDKHKILLDAGTTVKYIKEKLSELSIALEEIDYILILPLQILITSSTYLPKF